MSKTIPGFTIGHYTDAVNATGCAAVPSPPGTIASREVPATPDLAAGMTAACVGPAKRDAVLSAEDSMGVQGRNGR